MIERCGTGYRYKTYLHPWIRDPVIFATGSLVMFWGMLITSWVIRG